MWKGVATKFVMGNRRFKYSQSGWATWNLEPPRDNTGLLDIIKGKTRRIAVHRKSGRLFHQTQSKRARDPPPAPTRELPIPGGGRDVESTPPNRTPGLRCPLPTRRRVCSGAAASSPNHGSHTRKRLFARIRFLSAKMPQSLKKTFPDPSISPPYYTKDLLIDCPYVFTTADAEEGSWMRGFSQVFRLEANSQRMYVHEFAVSLAPLHGFSPPSNLSRDLRRPSVVRIVDLILSFPLLTVIAFDVSIDDGDCPDRLPNVAQPRVHPHLRGPLTFSEGRDGIYTRRLLPLPSGIHFRKPKLTWNHKQDLSLTTPLVEGCSHNLESLDVTSNPFGTSI